MRSRSFAFLLLAGSILATPALQAAPSKSGVDLTSVDKSVKPGDNFNDYANGAWEARTVIPEDRSNVGVFFEVFQKAESRTADLIKNLAAAKPATGSDEARIADYYSAYLDQAGIDARGLAPLKPIIEATAAIKDKAALSRTLGASMRADTDPINATNFYTENLFGLFVTQAMDNPDVTTAYMLQGGLGMPSRDYYLSTDAAMVKARTAYRTYITDLLTKAGLSDADARAQRIYDLEMKIAQGQASREESESWQNARTITRDAFAAQAPGIDWTAYFAAAGLQDQNSFTIWQPKAVTALAALVASEPLESWKDWLLFHRINQVADVLPRAIDDAHFAFYGTSLSGTPKQQNREKRAIASVNDSLGDAIGKQYVARYFPASAKADIETMVHNILGAFDTRVAALDWMAPATKTEARRKISTLRVGVGYPDNWRDYSRLTIRADDPLGNLERARLAEYEHQKAKLGQKPDRGEWWMTPQTVNAVNLPLQNAMNFPAAILEPTFYDPASDPAANYGSIGAVIGHEISHSFDNNGADFDADGKLRNWWTPEDLKRFDSAGQALADQYSAYEPLPGLHINGKLTLGENIADVAGLQAAYDAYHASLGGKPAPVINGLTGDQRFFLAFAQSWRTKMREGALRQRVTTDGHSPGMYRALTVRNLDAWYEAFGVKPGEKLYLAPDKRVRVW